MFQNLLVKKPIDQLMKEASNTRELKRVLGPLNLTTLGIGFGAAMAALCYAEFASTVPISGSAYTYAYATLGEIFAWIIGWDLMLEYLFGASTVAVGWSGYVVSFFEDFGIIIPSYLSSAPLIHDPILGWQTTGAFLNIPAMFIIAVMTTMLVIGIKESAVFNNIIVLVKISVLILFITFGIAYIKTGNWVPFIPPNTGEFGHYGLSGILRGAGVIFFAYFGFDAVSTAAQEARNPKKDMPIGILSSLVISTILYILVSLVLTGLVKYDQLHVPDPIMLRVPVFSG